MFAAQSSCRPARTSMTDQEGTTYTGSYINHLADHAKSNLNRFRGGGGQDSK